MFVHEMHGAPRNFNAVFERRTVHVQPVIPFAAKGRDKRGMNVNNSVGKRLYEIFRDHVEIARQHHKVDIPRVEFADDIFEHFLVGGEILFAADDRLDIVRFGAF